MRVYIVPEYNKYNNTDDEAMKRDTAVLSLTKAFGKIEHSFQRSAGRSIEFCV